VPANHRSSDAECSTPAPAGNCSIVGNLPVGCHSDSDCTAGTNGRCNNGHGGPAGCLCNYDTCSVDTDCPSSQTCACHGSAYTDGDGNVCVPGNCRVDADCGAQGYCSPSVSVTSCGLLAGYYCHTAEDVCVIDADCASQPGAMCMYSTTESQWECQTPVFTGCPV
jgi:hypothetical protein